MTLERNKINTKPKSVRLIQINGKQVKKLISIIRSELLNLNITRNILTSFGGLSARLPLHKQPYFVSAQCSVTVAY